MNQEESKAEESKQVRYDASGKKILTSPRSSETENAIIAINDKMDQLLGILASTLPTRIGSQIKESMQRGEAGNLGEILSKELPDRLKKDIDQIVYEKAEMLSVVFSTSIQHLQDAFKSYQDSLLDAVGKLNQTQKQTSELINQINALLAQRRGEEPEPPAKEPAETAPAKAEDMTKEPSVSEKAEPPEKQAEETTKPAQPPPSVPPEEKPEEEAGKGKPEEKPEEEETPPSSPEKEGKDKPGWLEDESFRWPPPSSEPPPQTGKKP